MYNPEHEDLKTYIPGVGFLVTSWDGSESRIFKIEEPAVDEDAEAELALQAQCQQYDDDLMMFEDNVDFVS